MANINGTNLGAKIVPFTTDDQYATHESQYGKGGWHEVDDLEERDAIPTPRLNVGMAVNVLSEGKVYILESLVGDTKSWKELSTGGGGGGGTIVIDAYTKAQADARFGSKSKEHTHENKVILDDLSEMGGDNLLFRNKPCGTIATKIYNHTYTGSSTSDFLDIIDVNEIATSLDIDAVYIQQISIKNESVTEKMYIQVRQDDLVLLNETLEAGKTQGYYLNHSSDLVVSVKGTYKVIYDLIGF